MGQDCDYASMEELLEEARSLNLQDYPQPDALQSVTNDLEGMLITCAQEEFPGKDSLEYQYYDNLVELCKKLADVESQVRYLNSLKDHSISDEKYSDIDGDIKRIEQDYGPLRIRFEGTTLKEMATLKTTGGKNININILPPANAWDFEKEEKRKEKRERLRFIQKKSLEGNLPVFFDSYNTKEGYFYYELPFVPYLAGNSSEDWYAITFDKKKRYRINFPKETTRKPNKPLIIKPEEGWFLEESTPEKWIKLSIDTETPYSKKQLMFEDRLTSTRLSSKAAEYIRIENEKSIDYYLPSEKNIDIIFPESKQFLWQYFNNIITGGLFVVLSYIIYNAGVT